MIHRPGIGFIPQRKDTYQQTQGADLRVCLFLMSMRNIVYAHMVPKELTGTVDKYYIGITNQSVSRRWGSNGKNYQGLHFSYAIKKYGWDNIKHIVLIEGLDRETAGEIEKYLIAKYHTDDKRFGYNISPGGDGGNRKPIISVSQYDMDGNFIAEYESAAEAARVLGISRTGITHSCKACKTTHGYQFRYSNGELFIGKYVRKSQYPVEQLDLDGNHIMTYSSIAEAYRKTGINKQTIHKVANNRKCARTAGGYIWRRLDDAI